MIKELGAAFYRLDSYSGSQLTAPVCGTLSPVTLRYTDEYTVTVMSGFLVNYLPRIHKS